MMPVAGNEYGYGGEQQIDYKGKYKTLKKKLKLLVYEQECFLEELRKAQRKLLKVSRDRSFLLDRLLQYEKVNDSSGDSDATASSDSDGDGHKDTPAKKRKLASVSPGQSGVPPELAHLIGGAGMAGLSTQVSGSAGGDSGKKKKSSLKKGKPNPKSSERKSVKSQPGQMTREELERHLDAKQNSFGIEKAPTLLPMEIFSNDNSNPDSLSDIMGGEEDDTDLIIDVPN
ncbi:INO80 complex subunit E-like isoform X3 [Haliotis cracherodii]|uniref:INO80 complex subunit E-like isoform X3 n=1 Tax=Haliotis rufescens TaxID=6454 RepID=UPI001EAFAFF6|nr:INO80 complex subunit E-like isoform X3 [Haliotis rufescens]